MGSRGCRHSPHAAGSEAPARRCIWPAQALASVDLVQESGVEPEPRADAVEGLVGRDRDPSRHSLLPIHHLCLFKLGVPLGEMWYLHELASWLREHGRSRFLLTAPPLRLPGAVGSPTTPIATV